MITDIAFDVGGVLMSDCDINAGVLEFLINEIKVKGNYEKLKKIVDDVVSNWLHEQNTGINLWSKYFSSEITQKILDEYKYFCNSKYQLLPSMLDLCKKLSKKYQIGILSNFPKDMVLTEKFDQNIFKSVIYSGLVGVRKPDPKIYQIYCETAKCKPESTLFIDNLQKNVDAAKNFGMTALLFTNQEKLENDLIENDILLV